MTVAMIGLVLAFAFGVYAGFKPFLGQWPKEEVGVLSIIFFISSVFALFWYNKSRGCITYTKLCENEFTFKNLGLIIGLYCTGLLLGYAYYKSGKILSKNKDHNK